MKNRSILIVFVLMFFLFLQAFLGQGQAERLSSFSLKGINGQIYDLSTLKESSLIVLYFFDPDSSPCQEGILWLRNLMDKYRDMDIKIWAISTSSAKKVRSFCNKSRLNFPVLLDQKGISKLYNATVVLPTVIMVGPDFQILDRIQGGGKGPEVMVLRLAQRELQRKNIEVAERLGEEVTRKDPHNVQARVVTGYAALKAGKAEKAKKIFSHVSSQPGQGEILGTEGLAAVYAYKGDSNKAMVLADRVSNKAPQRAYPHIIKGDLLYAEGKKREAEHEFKTAAKSPQAEPYQQGIKFNQLGRLYASVGKYQEARQLYDQAVAIDPYYVEGMANKGVTYEKQGKWAKSLQCYKKAVSIDKYDVISALLAHKAEEMLELQKDAGRSRRIDKLVKELAQRYREQKRLPPAEDQWTSRPMVLSFIGFQERGSLPERDGLTGFFTSQLADYLNSSGRVRVVERVILDKLLQELNLGSSDLADKETALKLGRILAAKLMGTGSFYFMPDMTILSMRMIDTETSSISMVLNKKLGSIESMDRDVLSINRQILKNVIQKYPIRGYIVRNEDDKYMLNVGSEQGVVAGTMFQVISKGKSFRYKGRILKGAPKKKGVLKVISVEPDLSYAVAVTAGKPFSRDDKIEEMMPSGQHAAL